MLRLSGGGDEDGLHPEGGQVELGAVSAPADHGLGTLQRRSEFGVGGVTPRGDVSVDADPASGLPCDDQAGLVVVLHPSSEGFFHQLPVRFDAADHADFAPDAFRLCGAVFGQAAQDADAARSGMDGGVGEGATQRSGTRLQVWNPNLVKRTGPAFHNRSGGAFQPFGRRELELVRDERRRHFRVTAPVAVVGHNGVDAMGRHNVLGPGSFALDVLDKRRNLLHDAQEIPAAGILDFRARLGVKRDVFLWQMRFQPSEGGPFRGHVHMPAFLHGMFDERQGPGGVPHAPIQDGDKELRPVLDCALHRG